MELKWSTSLELWRFKVRGLVFSHNLCIISFLLIFKSAYLWKVINCEFNWWNSCSYVATMFGYMNLMIIKLLMLNLHAYDVYTCILVFYPKLMKNELLLMNLCLIDVVVVMRWCCWWFIPWVFIITDLWHELSWKWVELMNYVEMIFDFMFDVFLKAFLSTWTCKQPLGTNLDVRGSKFGFLGEKWFEPVKNCAELMHSRLSELEASCKRPVTVSWLLKREVLRLSEMLSDSIPCFAFLSLFDTFLFWIGLWCKHESFR